MYKSQRLPTMRTRSIANMKIQRLEDAQTPALRQQSHRRRAKIPKLPDETAWLLIVPRPSREYPQRETLDVEICLK